MIELARHRAANVVALGGRGARTAGQLQGLVNAISASLAGPPEGSRVVLACQDRYYFVAALLALWQRGLVAALPSNGQPETVRALARAPQSAGLLRDVDDDIGLDVRLIETRAKDRDPVFQVAIERHMPAVVAYTSGSTGTPVAHEKTLAQLLDEPAALIEAFGLAHKGVLASVPPYHLYGLLFGVLVPLLGKGTLSRTSPLQPLEVLRELSEQEAEVLVAVPPHLSALAHEKTTSELANVRVFSSGAPLPVATERALAARGVQVTQVLGSTETGGIAFRTTADAPWVALPGADITSEDGLLAVASPWSAREPGARVVTGDRLELVERGFRLLGRADHVVKVGGRRVDLGDIEAHLRAISGVRDARVLARDSKSLRGVDLCAVVEAPALDVTVETLKRELAKNLDPVAVPRRFRIVAELPRTSAGKVTERALFALFDIWELNREPLEDGRLRMRIPEGYGYFRGHFDNDAILPGVVQLEQMALRATRERFPDLGSVARLTRVKFKRPIRPGEELVLELVRKGPVQVQFDIRCGDDAAASGIFHFRSKP
jgi:4-coumarate--CoA ligase (photoactive yellow protein activation family)